MQNCNGRLTTDSPTIRLKLWAESGRCKSQKWLSEMLESNDFLKRNRYFFENDRHKLWGRFFNSAIDHFGYFDSRKILFFEKMKWIFFQLLVWSNYLVHGPWVIKDRIMPNWSWKCKQWVVDLEISGLIWNVEISFDPGNGTNQFPIRSPRFFIRLFPNQFKRVQDQVIMQQNGNFTQVRYFFYSCSHWLPNLIGCSLQSISLNPSSDPQTSANDSKANLRIFITGNEDSYRIWLHANFCKYSRSKHHRHGRESSYQIIRNQKRNRTFFQK